jgi:hypothetical protein
MIFGNMHAYAARPLVHRQDKSARLSLGMVASQQSPLPFHLQLILPPIECPVTADSRSVFWRAQLLI